MAATVGECVCNGDIDAGYTITEVKEHIRYTLGEFPFTTARKIYHLRCDTCKGIMSADLNKELLADMTKNRAFIAEQDRMYSFHVDEGVDPNINTKGFKPLKYGDEYSVPTPSKQWHTGFIHYLRFLNTGDSVKIVPASMQYTVYCNTDEKLATAARQFVKPDDYFKLTSIT